MSDLLHRLRRLEEAVRPQDDHERHVLIVWGGNILPTPDGRFGLPDPRGEVVIPDCLKCQAELRQLMHRGELDAPIP